MKLLAPLLVFLLTLAVFVLPLSASADIKSQKKGEPLPVFSVKAGGQTFTVKSGEPLKIPLANPEITIEMVAQRPIALSGLEFLYPSFFSYSIDEDKPVTVTLEGNDALIMVFDFQDQSAKQAHASFINNVVATYGKGTSITKPTTLELPDKTLKGTRIEVRLAGHLMWQDVFTVRTSAGTVSFCLQDSPSDGEFSAEATEVRKLLHSSLKGVLESLDPEAGDAKHPTTTSAPAPVPAPDFTPEPASPGVDNSAAGPN